MNQTYHDAYLSVIANLRSQHADAAADLARAEAVGDAAGVGEASQRMQKVENDISGYDAWAWRQAAAMRPQQPVMPSKEMIHHMSGEDLVNTGYGSELLAAAGVFGPDVTPEMIAAEKAKRGWR